MNLTGILLAGGKSSRMGSDKGLMIYKGKRLIEYPLELLSLFCSEIIISSNNNDYLHFGYPVIQDEYKESGPAAGLASALKAASNEWNLVLSCDVPFINREAIDFLLSFTDNNLGVVPKHGRYVEPLVALYKKPFQEIMESNIREGNLQMNRIIDHPGIIKADFDPLVKKYPGIFGNFNVPEDLL